MKTNEIPANALKTLLHEKKTVTMTELKSTLNTTVNMTIFRKLKELSYITSYSHSGKYYTLAEIPDFDEQGIWQHNSAMFSIHGNLKKTVQFFIENSKSGYTVKELKEILKIEVKEPLLNLNRQKLIYRKKLQGCYVYFSINIQTKKKQLLHRNKQQPKYEMQINQFVANKLSDKIIHAIFVFFSTLNEKQQRLFAGLESFKYGHGGDKKVASLFGMDPHTVAKGRSEIVAEKLDMDRIRKKGAGRIPSEKKARK